MVKWYRYCFTVRPPVNYKNHHFMLVQQVLDEYITMMNSSSFFSFHYLVIYFIQCLEVYYLEIFYCASIDLVMIELVGPYLVEVNLSWITDVDSVHP